LLCFFCPSSSSAARWKTLKTDSFTVFYKPGDETRAKRLLVAMEKARPAVERLTGNHARHYPVVLQDMGQLVNSLTDPLNGVIQLFPCPPTSRDQLSDDDWFLMVGTHEYIHALQLSKNGGLSGLLNVSGSIQHSRWRSTETLFSSTNFHLGFLKTSVTMIIHSPNPPLNSDPACIAFRSLSTSRFLGFVHHLGAGGAG